jgi:hypothetical protein
LNPALDDLQATSTLGRDVAFQPKATGVRKSHEILLDDLVLPDFEEAQHRLRRTAGLPFVQSQRLFINHG